MATTLNPSEISELIRSRIEKFKLSAEARNEGTLTGVSDGIVRIHGLNDVMSGEMVELPGNTYALALNLERDSVGAVVLGAYEHITEGDTVKATGRILEVPVGPELIGRVVDSLGQSRRASAWGQKVKADVLGASFINGTSAQGYEIDPDELVGIPEEARLSPRITELLQHHAGGR